MLFSLNKLNYPAAQLKVSGGLSGIVALTDSAGHAFSLDDWARCVAELKKFENNQGEILKREGSNSVVIKELKLGKSQINAVVKTRLDKDFFNLGQYITAYRPFRNFRKAVLLKKAGIPAEMPLAALSQKESAFASRNIYITEFVPQSASLHWFAKRDLAAMPDKAATKKELARQLAVILAELHNHGLWHRDAKPSNFLVNKDKDGRSNLMLIDLDGIKPYHGFETFNRRFRSFVNLAPLILISRFVYKTDCLRTFKIYCNLTGLSKAERKRILYRLVHGPIAKRIKVLMMKDPKLTGVDQMLAKNL